ncbi:MAG: hypothetical protein R3F43_26345 [bacterium]
MRRIGAALLVLWATVGLVGCDDDGGSNPAPDGAIRDVGPGGQGGGQGGQGGQGGGMGGQGGGMGGQGGGMGGQGGGMGGQGGGMGGMGGEPADMGVEPDASPIPTWARIPTWACPRWEIASAASCPRRRPAPAT